MLEVETEKVKQIQVATSSRLCHCYWRVTSTLHQDMTLGLYHYLQDVLPSSVSSEDRLYKALVHADGGGGNSRSLPQNLLHKHCLY